jgi:hypothetical protein
MNTEVPSGQQSGRQTLIKRIGIIGFLFFLVKGLLWIIVPALLVFFGYQAN